MNQVEQGLMAAGYKMFGFPLTEEDKIRQEESFQSKEFHFNLSRIFTKKQKAIMLKRVRDELMTESEKQCYSRIVKKKLIAMVMLKDFALIYFNIK